MKSIADILVLFVDDEVDTISALKRFLRKQAFRKAFACSGAEALEIMEAGGVDILVTDILMPNMSGQELIEEVKKRFPDTVCLMVTGSNEVDEIVQSIGAGNIFSFITKPIEPEPFMRFIADSIEHYNRLHD
ncbi:MAG: response regulator [Chlorobiaceae bacterium]|nr:response regulator [Chlorobiaceae bacterium]